MTAFDRDGLIRTEDGEMSRVLRTIENVAASRATVLLLGESGTGKELLARMIHAKSPRNKARFVAINCAAVPEGLLESELFGHEKGAFTGAHQQKCGKFELASEGTILLDEISEMPMLLQAKLLRAIQEGEIERVGGRGTIRVNVRIVATSNRDLRDMVRRGQFREDLFYRLNVLPVRVPPLRERPKDIELLARYFMEMSSHRNGRAVKRIDLEAMTKLLNWSWPGNVRELENVIERAVLLSNGDVLRERDVQIDGDRLANADQNLQTSAAGLTAGMTVAQAEKALILKTLEFTEQNRTKAAQMLGISIRTLRNKLHEYGEMEVGHVG
ncbi:MAG: sigma-54-dependent Fis family transcriptional regulator [Bdellovibrionaceae bacterium]|nr:sigma-54-dependent Fis family transcriptional regulator [Pseudobdellovibrionaceae bacterium]